MQTGNKLKPYFSFTPNERRGLTVLVFLLVLVLIVRLFTPVIFNRDKKAYSGITISCLQLVISDSVGLYSQYNDFNEDNPSAGHSDIIQVKVDPNTATLEELKSAGFSFYVARNILKYRNSGGFYRNLNDLKKIYGMDSVTIEKIADKLYFDHTQDVIPGKSAEFNKIQSKVNLNNADSLQLLQISGIGPVLGQRIIRYRELLGGFVRKEQLNEVFGITPDCYLKIESSVLIDTGNITKLDVNKASVEKLSKHPYISDYQAKAIDKYRNYKHFIGSLNELQINNVFTSQEFSKVLPYLKIVK